MLKNYLIPVVIAALVLIAALIWLGNEVVDFQSQTPDPCHLILSDEQLAECFPVLATATAEAALE